MGSKVLEEVHSGSLINLLPLKLIKLKVSLAGVEPATYRLGALKFFVALMLHSIYAICHESQS